MTIFKKYIRSLKSKEGKNLEEEHLPPFEIKMGCVLLSLMHALEGNRCMGWERERSRGGGGGERIFEKSCFSLYPFTKLKVEGENLIEVHLLPLESKA